MVYRTSRLIGAAAIALALLRLMAVVSPTETGAPWQLVVGAAALLAAGVTWAALAYRAPGLASDPGERRRSGHHGHQGGGTGHGIHGGLPRGGHPRSTSPRADRRRRPGPIRRSAAGARGRAGGASGLLFWVMGALLVWATAVRRPLLGLVPPLLLGLQLATVDRLPAQPLWIVSRGASSSLPPWPPWRTMSARRLRSAATADRPIGASRGPGHPGRLHRVARRRRA